MRQDTGRVGCLGQNIVDQSGLNRRPRSQRWALDRPPQLGWLHRSDENVCLEQTSQPRELTEFAIEVGPDGEQHPGECPLFGELLQYRDQGGGNLRLTGVGDDLLELIGDNHHRMFESVDRTGKNARIGPQLIYRQLDAESLAGQRRQGAGGAGPQA